MAHYLEIKNSGLEVIRRFNPRLMSYNVEMTEITGYLFVGEAILQDSAAKAAALQEACRFVGEGMPQERIHRLIESLACHDAPTLAALVDTLELFAVRLADEQIFDLDKQEVAALTKAYVSQNYHKKLTLSELALHFHCSTVTLTEHFRAAYGTSIMAYVADMRMQKARDLLQNTSLSVGMVAERCGFESIEHFSKMFKRMHEKSPASWRKCQKKEHP